MAGILHNGFELPPKTYRWEGGTGVFIDGLVKLIRATCDLSRGGRFTISTNSPVIKIAQPPLNASSSPESFPAQVEAYLPLPPLRMTTHNLARHPHRSRSTGIVGAWRGCAPSTS